MQNLNLIILKLKWLKKKEEHHISLQLTEKLVTHHETIMDRATLSIPMEINSMESMLMVNVLEKVNISTLMAIVTMVSF